MTFFRNLGASNPTAGSSTRKPTSGPSVTKPISSPSVTKPTSGTTNNASQPTAGKISGTAANASVNSPLIKISAVPVSAPQTNSSVSVTSAGNALAAAAVMPPKPIVTIIPASQPLSSVVGAQEAAASAASKPSTVIQPTSSTSQTVGSVSAARQASASAASIPQTIIQPVAPSQMAGSVVGAREAATKNATISTQSVVNYAAAAAQTLPKFTNPTILPAVLPTTIAQSINAIITLDSTVQTADSILSVDDNTFAEVIDYKEIGNNVGITFRFSCKIKTTNERKKITSYDKIAVVVKEILTPVNVARNQGETTVVAKNFSQLTSQNNQLVDLNNIHLNPTYSSEANLNNMHLNPTYSSEVNKLLSSGNDMLKVFNATGQYLSRNEVSLVDATKTFNLGPIFSIPELRQLHQYTQALRQLASISTDPVDTLNLMPSINETLFSPTTPANPTETTSSRLSSAGALPAGKFSSSITWHYLYQVPGSPKEKEMVAYKVVKNTKQREYIQIDVPVKIGIEQKNSNVKVVFELYGKNSKDPSEFVEKVINVTNHVRQYVAIKIPPKVDSSSSQTSVQQSSTSSRNSTAFIDNIKISEVTPNSQVKSYNVYKKDINQNGISSVYKFVGNVDSKIANMSIARESNLSVVRVIPVDTMNNESNVFTDVIVGQGYQSIGNITMFPYFSLDDNRGVIVEVRNIPKDTIRLTLFRRDITNSIDTRFIPMKSYAWQTKNSRSFSFLDILDQGKLFEYYVAAELSTNPTSVVRSNYEFFRHPRKSSKSLKTISVDLTNFNSTIDGYGKLINSFELKSTLSKEEKQHITDMIKSELKELYDQFLDPANNKESPLKDEATMSAAYGTLLVHEVVRINLVTSSRETFGLVTDGIFTDDVTSCRKFGVSHANSQHSYVYQVFTYIKDPIHLFKNYIEHGKSKKGNEWFYLPYKWKQHRVLSTGRLYPDDPVTGIPMIELYDSLTAELVGMTASYNFKGSTQVTSISSAIAKRIDRNTVLITWNYSSDKNIVLYDSFVVMKVANGIRSFVGRTTKNFIYHEIGQEDVGTVYYIIVPLMNEFNMDDPGYTDPIKIEPDGIIEMTTYSGVS